MSTFPSTGLLLVASSQAFGSLMSVVVKKLNGFDPPVHPLELIWVRMVITWTCCVTYMSIKKIQDPILGPKGIRILLAFRGFCGFFGLFGSYYSLQYLTLSDSTVLQFLAPMCTAVTGAIILKEEFKCSQAVASLCSLVGVVLIARPQFLFGSASVDTVPDVTEGIAGAVITATPAQRLGAVAASLMGVLGATGASDTTIRAIGKRAHPMHNIVAFSSQCVITSTILILVLRVHIVLPTSLLFLAMLLAIGFLGFMGQMLMTMGLQRETAGRGTMAIYVQIIFATIYDRIFFNSTPSLLSVIGTVIIMTSAIYVALTKQNSNAGKTNEESSDDAALEEGLLSHQDEETEELKESETVVSEQPVEDTKRPLPEGSGKSSSS
ncbi:hypothetical protein BKA93DRAFT_754933 [Sparassis latifolia]